MKLHALRSAAGVAAAGALLAVGVAATASTLVGPALHAGPTTAEADTGWNAIPVTQPVVDPPPAVSVLDTGWN